MHKIAPTLPKKHPQRKAVANSRAEPELLVCSILNE